MNIFQYQGQEEDHYTNILMNILSLKNFQLVKPFLVYLCHDVVKDFSFKHTNISIRKKTCPQEEKPYELLLGIAPYRNAIKNQDKLEENLNSIPDAWICGENFNILIEFKIRGELDEAQLAAHRKLLRKDANEIKLRWEDVKQSLSLCSEIIDDDISKFLINQFLEVSNLFKDKRQSSGMPKQIISRIAKSTSLYFIITGSRDTQFYTIDKVVNESVERLVSDADGIMSSRRWIAMYVKNNYESLPINYVGEETIISDYCVAPGRPEKQNKWNQWRIGSMR